MAVRPRLGAPFHITIVLCKLQLNFTATACAGWPQIKILVDDKLVLGHAFSHHTETLYIDVPEQPDPRTIKIIRLGKNAKSTVLDAQGNIVQDQILELNSILIQDVVIPDFILNKHSVFSYQETQQRQSRYFGPNGIWTWHFATPLIDWVLDQRILHDADINDHYKYPWAVKLGPDSVSQITTEIRQVMDQIANK